jgi:hypothetical protein
MRTEWGRFRLGSFTSGRCVRRESTHGKYRFLGLDIQKPKPNSNYDNLRVGNCVSCVF